MNTSINFLAKNLLGTLDRQCGNLLTQDLTCLDRLLICFRFGSGSRSTDDLGT